MRSVFRWFLRAMNKLVLISAFVLLASSPVGAQDKRDSHVKAAELNLAHTQSGNWQTSAPHSQGFSIETPASLRAVQSFDGEHGVDYDPPQENRQDVSAYAAIETEPEDCRFGIIIISGRTRAGFLRSQPRDKIFWYLSVMLIGDDDDPSPDIEKEVDAGVVKGKEYFYIRDEQIFPNGRTGSIHTRGRIFDTGQKLYVLVFVGQKTSDLTSPDAERFLNSFRLRGRR